MESLIEIVKSLMIVISGILSGFCIINANEYFKQRKGFYRKGQLLGYDKENNDFTLTIKIFKDNQNSEVKVQIKNNNTQKYIKLLDKRLAKRFDVVEYNVNNEIIYKSYVRYGFYTIISAIFICGLLIGRVYI